MDLLALILAVMAGETTEQEISSAVSAWITAHPEAVTTVQDGAISRAKLDADLQEKTDSVGGLKSALASFNSDIFNDCLVINPNNIFGDYRLKNVTLITENASVETDTPTNVVSVSKI